MLYSHTLSHDIFTPYPCSTECVCNHIFVHSLCNHLLCFWISTYQLCIIYLLCIRQDIFHKFTKASYGCSESVVNVNMFCPICLCSKRERGKYLILFSSEMDTLTNDTWVWWEGSAFSKFHSTKSWFWEAEIIR